MSTLTPISLSLLNGFEILVDGQRLELPLASQRVVAFLGCRDKAVQRAFVAGNLWPDKGEARAGANLRSALWRLGGIGETLVEAVGTALRLGPRVRVDYRLSLVAARQAIEGASLVGGAADAIDLCSNDLLPDWYDEWLAMAREQFRQLRLQALERMARDLATAGQPGVAVRAALAAVAAEPLRESSHRALLEAHLADGNCCEAVRHYEAYRVLLRREIGVEPTAIMRQLVEPLLEMAAGGRQPHATG